MAKFIGVLLFLAILLGFVIPSFFLSETFASERKTTVAATPAEVAAVVNDFRTWEQWTAWDKEYDPSMVRTFAGEPGQVGHKMTWKGDKGAGSMEIVEIGADHTKYAFVWETEEPADNVIQYTPAGEGSTEVRWEMSGEFTGLPFERWFGLLMDGMIGKDFEKGLAGLKSRLEGGDAPTVGAESNDADATESTEGE